jgi:acid phosphatase
MKKILAILVLACPPLFGPAGAAVAAPSVTPTKVVYIGLENMSRAKAMKAMPYLKSLAAHYGELVGWTDSLPGDPSLPHYLLQAFGSSHNVHDNRPPKRHPISGQTIYGNAVAHGRTAKVYVQSQTGTCALTNQGKYMKVRHNGGIPYAVDEWALCKQIDVPLETNLARDVRNGDLPNVGWIAPDDLNNAHKPSTPKDADHYLKTLIPLLMSGPDYASGDLVIEIGAEEGSNRSNVLPFVVVHPSLHGTVVTKTHPEVDFYTSMLRVGGTPQRPGDLLEGFGLS